MLTPEIPASIPLHLNLSLSPLHPTFFFYLKILSLEPKTPEKCLRSPSQQALTHPPRPDIQSITDGEGKVFGSLEAPFPNAVRAIEQKQDVDRC